jgi:site-specific DNA-adenine methylase
MSFRYSGAKKRMLKYLPIPLKGTMQIIEPFAGSLSYSLNYKPKSIIGADSNLLIRELWDYLTHSFTLEKVDNILQRRPTNNIDLRNIYSGPELTLMRLQTSGVYVGQLSSYIHYAQHKSGIKKLFNELESCNLKDTLHPLFNDFKQTFNLTNDLNTICFLDPPYNKTSANYIGNQSVNYRDIQDYFISCKCPIFMTYGDGAKDIFPKLTWETLTTRKVPNIRRGGTTDRTEWITRKGI